ncbi:hypothetical protein FRC17_010187 [Serendipita sp. 399]|nr:hypothetical protein FRC17_010187 [Serendipita sp. 399]
MPLQKWCYHKFYTLIRDRFVPFVAALIVPELVLGWAIRHWFMTGEIVKRRPNRGLTRKHAFFISMGGYHQFQPAIPGALTNPFTDKDEGDIGKPCGPVDVDDIFELLDTGALWLPTEMEIEDRSKSDWIAKSIVLLQILWFIVQCIARKLGNLPLSELEVVTLSYTVINLAIYIAWWDKPQNVTWPVPLFHDVRSEWRGRIRWWVEALALLGFRYNTPLSAMRRTPTFYFGHSPKEWRGVKHGVEFAAAFLTVIVGSVFGAVHLLAWSSPFPTATMLHWWRYSSIALTVSPVVVLLGTMTVIKYLEKSGPLWARIWGFPCFLALIAGLLAYVIGRATTLILAFRTLNSLPPEAFRTVRWTDLFPHI